MNLIGKTGLFIALFTSTASSGAEELGRLFFTPEQRAQLEYSRQHGDDSDASGRTLTVNGIVQKNGGKVALEVTCEADKLPPVYQRITIEPDNDAIRADLDAGKPLAFAKLAGRGTHLRIA